MAEWSTGGAAQLGGAVDHSRALASRIPPRVATDTGQGGGAQTEWEGLNPRSVPGAQPFAKEGAPQHTGFPFRVSFLGAKCTGGRRKNLDK